ncbi:MAG: hypothetical protein A2Y33_11300 [Spirochaetes bacterium GWF1_51_8]|nr:MAG: hypothetical protein A2Y33_11300 [Spirochaetes bacterium GWF1_51_8]
MENRLVDRDKATIMIIDDIPENLQLLTSVLKDCGYRVLPSLDGRVALKAMENELPDLILLDIMMPEMDGYEVCSIIKKDERTKGIPVIFLTALDRKEDEERGLTLGAVDFISKPFDIPIVKKRIENHLELKFIRDNLENIVRLRTEELIKMNSDLKNEIEERKKTEELLQTSLHEKLVLFREVHHRIYNNMQIISSLLNLQISMSGEAKITEVFTEMMNRIQSMAQVHQLLYSSQSLSSISLKGYIGRITDLLSRGYLHDPDAVKFNLDLEEMDIGLDTAIPCGLVVNELITNCLKYSFPDGMKGIISIKLSLDNEIIELQISDNGKGFPAGFDPRKSEGMGFRIVFDLIEKQLDGNVIFPSSTGFSAIIRFPDKQYRKTL